LMRQLLSDAYRNSPTVSVSTTPAVIDVQGANATSDCTLTIRQQSDRAEPTYMHSLHMSWKKEQSYSLLLFPTTVWRVVNADYGPIVELDGDENFP